MASMVGAPFNGTGWYSVEREIPEKVNNIWELVQFEASQNCQHIVKAITYTCAIRGIDMDAPIVGASWVVGRQLNSKSVQSPRFEVGSICLAEDLWEDDTSGKTMKIWLVARSTKAMPIRYREVFKMLLGMSYTDIYFNSQEQPISVPTLALMGCIKICLEANDYTTNVKKFTTEVNGATIVVDIKECSVAIIAGCNSIVLPYDIMRTLQMTYSEKTSRDYGNIIIRFDRDEK